MNRLVPAAALLALLATGCNATSLAAAAGVPGAAVRVNGKLYAPADQVSLVGAGAGNIVGAGAGNYFLAVASGESVASGAKLTITPWGSNVPVVPATTDSAGAFAVDLGRGATYQAITEKGAMPSVIVVGLGDTNVTLDAANHMVAAKLLTAGKSPDGTAIETAIAKLREVVAAAPKGVSQAELTKAFDEKATAEIKTTLGL